MLSTDFCWQPAHPHTALFTVLLAAEYQGPSPSLWTRRRWSSYSSKFSLNANFGSRSISGCRGQSTSLWTRLRWCWRCCRGCSSRWRRRRRGGGCSRRSSAWPGCSAGWMPGCACQWKTTCNALPGSGTFHCTPTVQILLCRLVCFSALLAVIANVRRAAASQRGYLLPLQIRDPALAVAMQRGGAAAASAPQLALVPFGGSGGKLPPPPSRELQAEARAVRSGWAEGF